MNTLPKWLTDPPHPKALFVQVNGDGTATIYDRFGTKQETFPFQDTELERRRARSIARCIDHVALFCTCPVGGVV